MITIRAVRVKNMGSKCTHDTKSEANRESPRPTENRRSVVPCPRENQMRHELSNCTAHSATKSNAESIQLQEVLGARAFLSAHLVLIRRRCLLRRKEIFWIVSTILFLWYYVEISSVKASLENMDHKYSQESNSHQYISGPGRP